MKPLRYQNGIARDHNARFGFKIIKFCQGRSKPDFMYPEFNEREFYAFIAIEPQNLHYFEQHYKPLHCSDFAAFGEELLRGWGTIPQEDIVKYLAFKHNIEFDIDPAYAKHLSQLTLQALEHDFEETEEDGFLTFEKPSTPAKDHVQPISFHGPKKYPEKPVDVQRA